MAYNPSTYNPYGLQQLQPTMMRTQPVNGLVQVSGIEGAQMYQLPPGSTSPPLFLAEENAFFIKTTDDGGAANIKKYRFEEVPIIASDSSRFVTREYFDQQIKGIMEAINGKHLVPEQPETQGQ